MIKSSQNHAIKKNIQLNFQPTNIENKQKKLQLRQHALEIAEDTIQNMGTHGSTTGKTMTRIICFDHNNCYCSSSEPVTYEEDEL